MTITYRHADVRGRKVFYREAPEGPTILLLHGFPTSSFMFRNLTAGSLPRRRARSISPAQWRN